VKCIRCELYMWTTVVGAVDVRSCCEEERGERCKEIYMWRGISRMRVCEGYGVCDMCM
jgi:hypothetical protein